MRDAAVLQQPAWHLDGHLVRVQALPAPLPCEPRPSTPAPAPAARRDVDRFIARVQHQHRRLHRRLPEDPCANSSASARAPGTAASCGVDCASLSSCPSASQPSRKVPIGLQTCLRLRVQHRPCIPAGYHRISGLAKLICTRNSYALRLRLRDCRHPDLRGTRAQQYCARALSPSLRWS